MNKFITKIYLSGQGTVDFQEAKKRFDTHAFDLSHPNLSVFLQREYLIDSVVDGAEFKEPAAANLQSVPYPINSNRHATAPERRQRLFAKTGLPDSNLYRDRQTLTEAEREILRRQNLSADCQYAFADIKVYPRLGFDPWPDDTDERDKVKYLYSYCIERRIPVTTHCSDSGYKPEDNNHLTSHIPAGKWAKVLNAFPELTLNFARFGSRRNRKKQWRDAIIEWTNRYDRVYTDISCKSASYYKELADLLIASLRLQERVLYSSDFSINLLVTDTNCYSENPDAFLNATLEPSHQINICKRNPRKVFIRLNKPLSRKSSDLCIDINPKKVSNPVRVNLTWTERTKETDYMAILKTLFSRHCDCEETQRHFERSREIGTALSSLPNRH